MGGMSPVVRQILVHPVHGEAGRDLESVRVGAAGLEGDRPKKAPVMVLSSDDTSGARANFVVDLPVDVLGASVGQVLAVGAVELDVTGPAGSCPGVYAAVRRPGTVRVGDDVAVRPADDPTR
jgi:uncharacterized protein YcbX